MNCSDSYQADLPIQRVLRRTEKQIGTGLLTHLLFAFRDESLNNRALAKRYGITLFDTIILRKHPYGVFDYLTTAISAKSGKSASVLQFKQSA